MEPTTTLAAIKLGASAVSAIGSLLGGGEQADAAEMAAAIARQNARLSIRKGEYDVGSIRKGADKFLGMQRASIAESGLGSGGTNAALAAESIGNIEADVTNTRREAALKAAGYGAESDALIAKAGNSRFAGNINGASSLLTGASDFYADYRKLR